MKIDSKKTGGTLTVKLKGELDHHSADYVRVEVDRLIEDRTVTQLVFDLSGLSFMDSSGIGVLLGRYKKMQRRSGTVALKGAVRQIDKILSMAGLYSVIRKIG
ncbi:MAG: STAS domain-containing protein [Christensenellales bacterium]